MSRLERGQEVPDAFYQQPEVFQPYMFYWTAFHELGSERQIGMGVGPIPRSAIKAYAEEFEIFGDDFDKFLSIIRTLDSEYLSLVNNIKKDKGDTVPADDVDGVRAVMGRLQARAAAAKKKH